MNEIKEYTEKMFDDIKHIDEEGNEYWLARELMPLLEYKDWRNFNNVIEKAIISSNNSYPNQKYWGVEVNNPINSNNDKNCRVPEIKKPIITGKGKEEFIKDYKLSRYICYLIVQNANPKKKIVAYGQTYFAIQTRKQELSEKGYNELTEDEKRFYQRDLTRKGNYSLNIDAKNAGVKNFDKFHNAGYKGLYNGETANDIARRKNLRYREDILDNMGSEELIANLFRISQTEAKLKKDNIKGDSNANDTHYKIGKNIREVIAKNGGTMPEELPTPEKSLKKLEKEKQKLEINH